MPKYTVFVNVPATAFTQVADVEAENEYDAKRKALKKVRLRFAIYYKKRERWLNDETDKVKQPKEPFEWTPVVTGTAVAERSYVEDHDVERAEDEQE